MNLYINPVPLHNTGCVNSLWPSDAIWRHRSGSTLAQVMACCLTAPSHYLDWCWLTISKIQWHSSEGNFTRDNSAINISICWKITYLRFQSNLPGANELTHWDWVTYLYHWIGSSLVLVMVRHIFGASWPGVGVTKPIFSVPLFSQFFTMIKTLATCMIPHSYLTGVTAAELRRHLTNMNVIEST